MDAIILAGGRGTRMKGLTADTPKPLLLVRGKPILEWILRAQRPSVDHVIIVVNYLKEQIEAFMAVQRIIEAYTLVEQIPKPMGTGHAVQCCRSFIRSEAFLVNNGDDLIPPSAISRLTEVPAGILTSPRDDQERWGVAVRNADGHLLRLHEKPDPGTYPVPVQVNTGAFKLNRSIFDYDLPLSERGEYELTDYVTWLAEREAVHVVEAEFWFPVGTPDDLAAAQQLELDW